MWGWLVSAVIIVTIVAILMIAILLIRSSQKDRQYLSGDSVPPSEYDPRNGLPPNYYDMK
jgi:hypothetical protein